MAAAGPTGTAHATFTTALLVLSLDLIVGVAGLATLGQAALFGAGAYAAGIFALHALADPLVGLVVGILAGALVALVSGAFLLRYHGFTMLMLTVAVAQILASLANKARDWTGGDDGLTGFAPGPVIGLFEFDLEGRTAALYTLMVLVLALYVARRVVDSPFGLAVRGIHDNRARMAALGTPVFARLLAMYTLVRRICRRRRRAQSPQTNAIVGLDSLSLRPVGRSPRDAHPRRYRPPAVVRLIGATVFTVLHHTAASINPYHWMFVIGGALMVVVILPPARIRAWIIRNRIDR